MNMMQGNNSLHDEDCRIHAYALQIQEIGAKTPLYEFLSHIYVIWYS